MALQFEPALTLQNGRNYHRRMRYSLPTTSLHVSMNEHVNVK